MDLVTGTIDHGGLLVHPGIDGLLSQETNDIYAILPHRR